MGQEPASGEIRGGHHRKCRSRRLQLARSLTFRFNATMRGGVVILLLGLTALGAYSIGRHDLGAANAPSSPVAQSPTARALALAEVPNSAPAQPPARAAPTSTVTAPPIALPERAPQQGDTKRKVEVALTAAAIAAILIKASRDQYHASGRPCACPDDTMRNGRACGGRSAYSRFEWSVFWFLHCERHYQHFRECFVCFAQWSILRYGHCNIHSRVPLPAANCVHSAFA